MITRRNILTSLLALPFLRPLTAWAGAPDGQGRPPLTFEHLAYMFFDVQKRGQRVTEVWFPPGMLEGLHLDCDCPSHRRHPSPSDQLWGAKLCTPVKGRQPYDIYLFGERVNDRQPMFVFHYDQGSWKMYEGVHAENA